MQAMKRWAAMAVGVVAVGFSLGSGCPLGLNVTTVRLVNNAKFTVDVRLFYGKDQLASKEFIKATGTERNFTIAPGASRTLTVNCDDLQAIFIDNASQQILGGLGPDRDTNVLRDGSDFGCGDTIRYEFTGTLLIVDFDINTSITNG